MPEGGPFQIDCRSKCYNSELFQTHVNNGIANMPLSTLPIDQLSYTYSQARSARHYPSKALLHDISKTCEELEIIKGIIKTQQKTHSKIVGAIDRSLPTTKSESRDHQQSETNKSPKDATERSFIGRSAWMKTVKVLEDIEQLQGEGKRLAEQVSLSPTCNL